MKQINVDAETTDVKRFIEKLPAEPTGVELLMNGRVICTVIPSLQLSPAEKERLVKRRWELICRAQERNKGVPASVIEREVREAVEEVRRRKQQ